MMARPTRTTLIALLVAALVTIAISLVVSGLFLTAQARIAEAEAEAARYEALLIADLAEQTGPAAAALLAARAPLAEATATRPQGATVVIVVDDGGRQLAGPRLRDGLPETGGGARDRIRLYVDARPAAGAGGDVAVDGVLVPLRAGGGVFVGRPVGSERAFGRLLLALLAAGVAAIGVATYLSVRWSSRASERRVAAVTVAIERIMAGDLSQRLPYTGDPEGGGDETDRLAGEVNGMLERIERLMAGLRDVSDNIAHDLKTPLNRLRNRLEVALSADIGVDDLRAALARTIEEADDIIRTFDALLLVARLEAKAVTQSAAMVDVRQMLDDVADLYEPVAAERGVGLSVAAGGGPVMVSGNLQLLTQAVTNLVENALKYGSDGAAPRITLACAHSGAGVAISVSDNGCGIAAEHRDAALRRFTRLDPSRSLPGSGLGLSLVAAVADLHGGRVELSDAGPGLCARLVLPRGDGAHAGPSQVAEGRVGARGVHRATEAIAGRMA